MTPRLGHLGLLIFQIALGKKMSCLRQDLNPRHPTYMYRADALPTEPPRQLSWAGRTCTHVQVYVYTCACTWTLYSMRHKKGYTVNASSSHTDAYTTNEYAVRTQVMRLRSMHARGASTLGGVYMYEYVYLYVCVHQQLGCMRPERLPVRCARGRLVISIACTPVHREASPSYHGNSGTAQRVGWL